MEIFQAKQSFQQTQNQRHLHPNFTEQNVDDHRLSADEVWIQFQAYQAHRWIDRQYRAVLIIEKNHRLIKMMMLFTFDQHHDHCHHVTICMDKFPYNGIYFNSQHNNISFYIWKFAVDVVDLVQLQNHAIFQLEIVHDHLNQG